ncbi:MAG: NGG1p interacting factor NIF3 [Candidatus Moraniibacteriota bacterium]|nr:MAG: NGG1p interacting factor NIF3 [Candidatus Moranbacteria bacterium]
MITSEIFSLAVELGIHNDFRSKKTIKERLSRLKKEYEALSEKDRRFFDKDSLENPYTDSGIHYMREKKRKVSRVLAGIDIDGAEIILADILSKNTPENPIDLIISHHPIGRALAGLDSVMDLQVNIFEQYGIPVNIAEGLMHKRISEVSRGIHPINHFQTIDMARLLQKDLINVHTPSDNMVATFLKNFIEKRNPRYVGDIVDAFMDIPEYQEARKQGVAPKIFAGRKENRVGKIAITEITGGTEGSPEMYRHIANAGIGTIIAMHQSERHRKEAEKSHINVIVAGHMSSDSIGMNLFLDELERRGIEIVPCSGLIRYSRK